MICLSVSGSIVSASPAGPDGCAAETYVALSPVEFEHYMVSPFKLSLSDAGLISSAVLMVWALGFSFRVLIRALRDSDSVEHPEN